MGFTATVVNVTVVAAGGAVVTGRTVNPSSDKVVGGVTAANGIAAVANPSSDKVVGGTTDNGTVAVTTTAGVKVVVTAFACLREYIGMGMGMGIDIGIGIGNGNNGKGGKIGDAKGYLWSWK